MNGKPFLLMVHANAKLYVMTTHANAAAIGLVNLGKTSNYGITAEGHVSDLGRTSAVLKSLALGNRTASDVRLSVFEIPQTPPLDGMLGMDWLRDQRVIVDFDAARIGIPETAADAEAEHARLSALGYVAHRLTWDPGSKSYFVMGTINGITARFGVSTVGENVIDSEFAKRAGIALGPVVGENGGPQGAVVPVMITKRQASFVIDGQATAPTQPWAYDLYAYSSADRPAASHDDGFLGADFMLANQAIIDFGTGTLFIAPR